MSSPLRLPAHVLRRLAVAADCDPRSVQRAIEGERVQPLLLERIARALERAGYPSPLAADVITGRKIG
jgi:hypothetical protein